MTFATLVICRMRWVELSEISRQALKILRGGLSQVHAKRSCYVRGNEQKLITSNILTGSFVFCGTEHGCPSKFCYLPCLPWPSASDGFLVFAITTLSLTNVTLGYTEVNWLGDKWFSWKLTLIPSDHEQLFTTPGDVLSPYLLASPASN